MWRHISQFIEGNRVEKTSINNNLTPTCFKVFYIQKYDLLLDVVGANSTHNRIRWERHVQYKFQGYKYHKILRIDVLVSGTKKGRFILYAE